MTKPTHAATSNTPDPAEKAKPQQTKPQPDETSAKAEEIGGPKGPEPTRFGDWEQKGRCSDF